MARSRNPLWIDVSGAFAKTFVIKGRGKKRFITKYPYNTGRDRKLSPKQMAYAELMENAAWWASGTMKMPKERDAAMLRLDVTRKQLYHALVKEFFAMNKAEKLADPHDRTREWHKDQFSKKKYNY